ncbi:hypothetical protein BDW22DRAFT_589326 [Trametopsis cervina]|nr:hypothetical protein BDW22DRAFT_589326 [Trametopsis cervina]
MPRTHELSRQIWHHDGDSVVFGHMADMPQPQSCDACPGAGVYEGCPLIALQDSPADMAWFLEATYQLHCCAAAPSLPVTFARASALLRLGTKYGADAVRRRAIDILASVYPCTNDAWLRRDAIRQFPPFVGELGATLTLAIEHDVHSLLPSILYTAAKLPPPDVISEIQGLALHPEEVRGLITRYLAGRTALCRAEANSVMGFLTPYFTNPKCKNPNPHTSHCAANPFKIARSTALCAACCQLIEKSIRDEAEDLWRRVPGMFGFADWETLKAADDLRECH